MIDSNAVNERIGQLQQEREQVATGLQELDAERERVRHLISAYDGAIGELSRLIMTTSPNGAGPMEGAE